MPGGKGSPTVSHSRALRSCTPRSDQEIVALSGAHTLGRCHTDRSGFKGERHRRGDKQGTHMQIGAGARITARYSCHKR